MPEQRQGVWFKPYTMFEKVQLRGGVDVSNVSYGSLFGVESGLTELKHGWYSLYGGYASYNGSHQAFSGNSIYNNGGLAGAYGVFYKGGFFSAWTANAGANSAEASTRFGKDNFAFVAGDVKFVCLNTNALEYDYSHPVPNFNFMEDELRAFPAAAEKTVVAMHVPPGDGEFNNNVGRAFGSYVKSFPDVQFCLYGHVHSWQEEEFFGDGVVYYGCTTVGKRGYFVITMKEDGYEIERCDF